MAKKKFDVSHIAKLARLSFTPTESKQIEKELSRILDYVEKISKVNVSGLEPTAQVTGMENVLREDVPRKERILESSEALKNAKEKERGLFRIQKIL